MLTNAAGAVFRNSPDLIPPLGHYSYATAAHGFVFVSGMLPLNQAGDALGSEPFDRQVEQVFANVESALTSFDLGVADIVSTRIYLTDLGLWPVFNTLYETWMADHRPSRAVVGVSELHYAVGLEMEVVAAHHVKVGSIHSNGEGGSLHV